jgi:hypothetical protein
LHDVIRKARPAGDPQGLELQDAFKDSFVHFSHFTVAYDEEMLCVDDMYTALIRGMALRAGEDCKSMDAVIPIHMGQLDDKISPASTSAINILAMNRSCSTRRVFVDRSITVPNSDVPVLSVVMELGGLSPRSGPEECLVEFKKLSTCPSSGKTHDKNHYVLVAYGHGPRTYGVVSEDTEIFYSQILTTDAVTQEFPRSHKGGNVQALYNLKPFFEGGEDSRTGGWVP